MNGRAITPAIHNPKPFVIPIFIPHAGCPHRCVFCDQHQATGIACGLPSRAEMTTQITRYLRFRRNRGRWTEISFYGGNFLGLAPGLIGELLDLAAGYVRCGEIDGIRFSTRPDTIDSERLALLADFPVSTIELGVQSMNDEVLTINGRGHTSQDTKDAVALLRKSTACRLGLQLMIGMAGDSPADTLPGIRRIIALAPDFVRIYPLLVLKGSILETWHRLGRYRPLKLTVAVDQAEMMFRNLTASGISVVRMGLQPTAELNPAAGVVAGPFHPAFGELVRAAAWRKTIARHLIERTQRQDPILIRTHPRCVSQIRGQKNENISYWFKQFKVKSIDLHADGSLPLDVAVINGTACGIAGKKGE